MVPVTVGQTQKQHFLQTMDKAHSKGHVNLLNIDPWEIKVLSIQNTWRRFRNHILIVKDTNPPGIYAY